MDDTARRQVIAAQNASVKKTIAELEAQRSVRRKRYSIGFLVLAILILGAWRSMVLRGPTLQAQVAREAATPLTAADAAARRTPHVAVSSASSANASNADDSYDDDDDADRASR